ncbi:MAG: 2-phospho-L-lactate guanylyltransferase [Candidatus Hermodarchaeota archaeon]
MKLRNTVALIPVRFLPEAKHRLAENWDTSSRRALVQAMLADVLSALDFAKTIGHWIIVTCDESFSPTYHQDNVETYRSTGKGLNFELMACIQLLAENGIQDIVIVLADLPLLTKETLDEIVTIGQRTQSPVIAQDWKGTGTNILFSPLPLPIELCFGNQSLQKYRTRFEEANLTPIIYHSVESALDIDDDLAIERFLLLTRLDKKRQQTHTYRLLDREEKKWK